MGIISPQQEPCERWWSQIWFIKQKTNPGRWTDESQITYIVSIRTGIPQAWTPSIHTEAQRKSQRGKQVTERATSGLGCHSLCRWAPYKLPFPSQLTPWRAETWFMLYFPSHRTLNRHHGPSHVLLNVHREERECVCLHLWREGDQMWGKLTSHLCDVGRSGVILWTATLNCSFDCCFVCAQVLGFFVLVGFCLFVQPPFFTESFNEIIQQDISPGNLCQGHGRRERKDEGMVKHLQVAYTM